MGYKEKIMEMRGELRELNKAAPEAMQGFGVLSKAVKETGVLDAKQKELIAIGMAVAMRCEPCINFHVETLMKYGGTREELVDVLAMGIQMTGGPGVMYAGHALACWDELSS